ncbi:Smr/MutS family protein, partial [Pseudoalteromonas aurantia]
VLKSYTNKWLQEMPQVLAFHSALKCHGGSGSTYVLLRKSDEKKQENRERHAKR